MAREVDGVCVLWGGHRGRRVGRGVRVSVHGAIAKWRRLAVEVLGEVPELDHLPWPEEEGGACTRLCVVWVVGADGPPRPLA